MTIVRPRRLQRDGLFGALLAVFVLALLRGLTGAATSGGRIAVAVFTGAVIAFLLWGWIRSILRPSHLEISAEAVTQFRKPGWRSAG